MSRNTSSVTDTINRFHNMAQRDSGISAHECRKEEREAKIIADHKFQQEFRRASIQANHQQWQEFMWWEDFAAREKLERYEELERIIAEGRRQLYKLFM